MLAADTKTENLPLQIRNCGLTEYSGILEQQHKLRDKRLQNKIPNTILITEHRPVITLGARKSANKLLAEPEAIKKQGVDIVEVRRGGGVTAHNPGQIVFYPILNLQQLKLGVSEYVRKLESIGAELLAQLDVTPQRRKGFPGLWVGQKKIASIGVRVSKFITYHGMAINIQNDLRIFDLFVPCGLNDVKMTSVLDETSEKLSMTQIKKNLAGLLINHFSSEGLMTL